MSTRWAYASIVDEKIQGVHVKETESNDALLGFFYFKSWGHFIRAAKTVLRNKWSVDNKFYVPSVLNAYIIDEMLIEHSKINIDDVIFYG
jgi:hypothetical protein